MNAERIIEQKAYEIDRNQELKQWFKTYYIEWLQTCDNQRWIVRGRTPKHPTCLLPFMPFCNAPAVPYHTWLTKFIDTQLCREADRLPKDNDLGHQGHMYSVIKENGWEEKQPYIMFERVDGGIVTDYVLFRNATLAEVKKAVADQYGIDPEKVYRKHVTTKYLGRIYQLHKDWLLHGDNALYLIRFVAELLAALKDGHAGIKDRPKLLENLQNIVDRSIHLGKIDLSAAAEKLTPWFPNVCVDVRGERFPIDLGGKYTLVIDEQAIWAFLDGLKSRTTLSDLCFFLFSFLGWGMRAGWVRLEGAGWITRVSAFFLRRRIKSLPKKIQILSKIMADPFRILLIAGQKAVLMEMVNGLPNEVASLELTFERKDESGVRPATLRELWLEGIRIGSGCAGADRFIHLAVRIQPAGPKNSYALRSFGFSVQEQVEIYPQNDFIKYIVRKGALQAAGLAAPFLSA